MSGVYGLVDSHLPPFQATMGFLGCKSWRRGTISSDVTGRQAQETRDNDPSLHSSNVQQPLVESFSPSLCLMYFRPPLHAHVYIYLPKHLSPTGFFLGASNLSNCLNGEGYPAGSSDFSPIILWTPLAEAWDWWSSRFHLTHCIPLSLV